MSITRRTFTKASLAVSAIMAAQPKMFAMENEVIKRVIPSSGEVIPVIGVGTNRYGVCLLYTSPSPRDRTRSRMPSSA